jgi:uncharacterized protein
VNACNKVGWTEFTSSWGGVLHRPSLYVYMLDFFTSDTISPQSEAATESISIQMARQVMLAAQSLAHPPDRLAVKADILDVIRRLGVLQIDTIHVVARSHYLVLWSRLGDYQRDWLDELQNEGALFEYWVHAMCYLPIEDYPLYRRLMLDAMTNRTWPVKWAVEWSEQNPQTINRIRTHLQENGAVRSAEFENKERPPGGWWNWKEEKDALEALLYTGEVMVARRQNFQRVYDLRERVLPSWDEAAVPSSEELRRTQTLRTVSALGIAFAAWVPDYFRQPKKGMPKFLEALAAEGLLLQVKVDGFEELAYVHSERLGLLEMAFTGGLEPTLTTLLSPFDPLVWDRQRARRLFDFDYTIECYTPAVKRRYGYFTLPILHRGQLIGRLDPKAHRTQGIFEIKALHLEPGVVITEVLVEDLAAALLGLAAWHATPETLVRQSDPPKLADLLNRLL